MNAAYAPLLLCRYLGAAGTQYGRYVERVLYSPALPRQRTAALTLSRVALGAWEEAPSEAGRLRSPTAHVFTVTCYHSFAMVLR